MQVYSYWAVGKVRQVGEALKEDSVEEISSLWAESIYRKMALGKQDSICYELSGALPKLTC